MSTITKKPLPKTLKALVDEYIPTSISNEKEYDRALKLMDRLMGLSKLTKGQVTYLNTLCDLVQVYEEEHHKIDPADVTGLDMLKFLMEDREMTVPDLGKLLGGSPSLGYRILKGERVLTLEYIKILARHFCVSPDAFIDYD
jgi:antitoxin component HigA of HigAB toxin-antitoxin module